MSRTFPPVSLIGVPTDVGAGHRGARLGPEALRIAGLPEALAGRGVDVRDIGNLQVRRTLPALAARLVGPGMAKQMIYTARNIKADEAYRIGLVNAVYPLSDLYAAAEKLAGQIAGNAPIAVRASKQAINDGLQVDIDRAVVIEEKAFGSCFQSADQQEGMGAFLEKRKHEPYQNK